MVKEKFWIVFNGNDYKSLKAAIIDGADTTYDTEKQAMIEADPSDIVLECVSVAMVEREYKLKSLPLK